MRSAALVVISVIFAGTAAHAIEVGAVLPHVVVESAAGVERALPDGHAHVIVVEDGDSQKHKQAAHAIVGRYSDVEANRAYFDLVAVAEVERWRWWPARGYVLRATAKSSDREHTPIWLDWHGAFRRAFSLAKSQSTFIVVDANDRVRFFAQGTLNESQQHALDAAISALVQMRR